MNHLKPGGRPDSGLFVSVQDPSQYVVHQMEALEAEQSHIDNRASVVERKLRQLLETGRSSFWALLSSCLHLLDNLCR